MPIQQMFLGLGAVDKTYVDDLFSTQLWTGNSTSPRTITTGFDMASDGGMVWIKKRESSSESDHIIGGTGLGDNNYISANSNAAKTGHAGRLRSLTSTGFEIGSSGYVNETHTYSGWAFKQATGFFDVVAYSGDNSSNRAISHSLGSAPGLILVKATSTTKEWQVWHREQHGKVGVLDTSAAFFSNANRFPTIPTSTNFYVGNDSALNDGSTDYVAYLFAGGESTADTARSVVFDGNDKLDVPSSTDFDFGSGDFTVEAWVATGSGVDGTELCIVNRSNAHAGSDSAFIMYIQANGTPYFGITENTGWDAYVTGTTDLVSGSWNHVAATREGNYLKMYVNGTLEGTTSWSGSIPTSSRVVNIGAQDTGIHMTGSISNVRIVKGTAVYTSSFRPLYEPLTNVTNTKLLCCNNSSVTGATVIPTGSISTSGDPTASTDSPFDDPAGFVFGDSEDKNVIKCGSYKTDSNEDANVDLGWEPQWVLGKRTDSSTGGDWFIIDSMRGFMNAQDIEANNGGSKYLEPNTSDAEDSTSRMGLTSTGFYADQFGSNRSFIYLAIRRPDGYVGKPADAGTDAFTMDTGNGSATIPAFDSGFPVDFQLNTKPASTWDKYAGSRLTQGKYLATNSTNGDNSSSEFVYDSNVGWSKGTANDSTYQSWMWKRGLGCDVVTYKGLADTSGNITIQHVPHSLGKTPEMMWVKRRESGLGTANWYVYHKGLNDGSSPQNYSMILNGINGEGADAGIWKNTAPTASHFTVGGAYAVNQQNKDFIALLFSSVNGISKVGSYTGNGNSSGPTVTLGFAPRLVIIKSTSNNTYWFVFDTLRGFSYSIALQENAAQDANTNYITGTATGFQPTTTFDHINGNNETYIYYAHA